MRKFGLFLCLSLLFAFTGCSDSDDVEEQGGTVLAKPSVAVTTTTSSSFKVAWDAVPNAESYKYRLSQENETGDELVVQPENSTSATALAFGDLDPKTKYILRVKAVAAASSGLTDSEYSKIFATTLAEEAAELTFEKIAATNPTYESVDVEIVPSAENLYYWQVVENSLIEGKSDREIVAALKENISELSSGTVKKTVHGLKADTEYTVVAFGYDLDAGKSTSAVARLEAAFTTPADDRMTIAITVGEVADNNVHVTFEPSVADGRYFADVVAAADIAGKSEYEIVVLLQNKYGAEMTDIVRNGKFETDVAVEENKNYVAVAFGYNVAASEFLTQFFRAEIKNGGDEPGMSEAWVNMACVYGTISGQPGIGAELYPNDKTVKVKAGGFTLTGPATSLEEIGMTEASLRERIMKEGIDVTPSQGSYQVSAPTEYGQVWLFGTIGIDEQGNAGEANWFIVKAQASASTEPEILGMSDKNDETGGDEPIETDAWSDITAVSWEMQDAGLAIFFDCEPNKTATAVTVGAWTLDMDKFPAPPTSLEEIGIRSESELRSMTLEDGIALDMEKKYVGLKTNAGEVWLFSTVAADAEGKNGAVNWVIAQVPASPSGEYGACTILGQSENNNAGGIELVGSTYEDYLGAWTLVSYGSAIVGEKGYQFTETPLQFNVRIEKDVEGQSYKVYGWNADTEFANANPFIMNYDPKETEGIGGWLNIPLAQVVKTEGNIDWTLCPRFLSGETYYYYTNTDMDKAFIGAREKEGAVVIQGGQYEFTGGIGVVQILSMNFMGIDKDNPKGEAQTRPLETKHALAPYVLVKGDLSASNARNRMQISRKAADIARVQATINTFASLSTAAAIGAPRHVAKPTNIRQINGRSTGMLGLGTTSESMMTVYYRSDR